MGQYHMIVNLDRHEYIYPHAFGDGAKLHEFGASANGTMVALAILLAVSWQSEEDARQEWTGRWAGDRLVIVGDEDYGQPPRDLLGLDPKQDYPAAVYGLCSREEQGYRDVSGELRPLVEALCGVKFHRTEFGTWASDDPGSRICPDVVVFPRPVSV